MKIYEVFNFLKLKKKFRTTFSYIKGDIFNRILDI